MDNVATGPMPGPFSCWWSADFFGAPREAACTEGFEDLSQHLKEHADSLDSSHASKRDAPLLFAGAYQPHAMTKAACELDATMLPPFALVDLDGAGSLSVAQVVTRVRALLPGARVDLWTTHSHGSSKGTRMRALVALTRGPSSLEEFSLVWSALHAVFSDLGPDAVCHDATRGHAFPAAPLNVDPEYHRLPGWAADTDALATRARARGIAPRVPATGHAERPATVTARSVTRDDLEDFIAFAERTDNRHLRAALAVYLGEAIAPQGERYAAARDLVASLWCWVRRTHRAWMDGDSCRALMSASLTAMAPTSKTELDVVGLVESFAPKGEALFQERSAEQRALAQEEFRT